MWAQCIWAIVEEISFWSAAWKIQGVMQLFYVEISLSCCRIALF